jgi:hypothetical protein
MLATADLLQKFVKTVTEGIRASNRSNLVAKRRVIQQFDSRNTSLSSCDTSLHDYILLTTIPLSPPKPVLGAPPMMAPYARTTCEDITAAAALPTQGDLKILL